MSFYRMLVLFFSVVVLAPMTVLAETEQELAAVKALITEKLAKADPRFKIASFKPAAIAGFYMVQIDNGPKIYFSKDGKNFFEGNLYGIENDKLVNLTEKEETRDRIALMGELKPAEMIVFSPKSPVKTKAHINVFTDVDCGYCRKLHSEMAELNALGIEVRYLAFPRAGIGSESYKKIVTAWCSPNKQEALTKLKNNETVAEKNCNNPVATQYDLGRRMGVTGTPAIILDDGTLIPGYRPAADMAKILGI